MTFLIGICQFHCQFHCKSDHKQAKSNKIKILILFFLIYKVVHYLNDFGNLFLGKVYLKNE